MHSKSTLECNVIKQLFKYFTREERTAYVALRIIDTCIPLLRTFFRTSWLTVRPFQNGVSAEMKEFAPSLFKEIIIDKKDGKMKMAKLLPLKLYPVTWTLTFCSKNIIYQYQTHVEIHSKLYMLGFKILSFKVKWEKEWKTLRKVGMCLLFHLDLIIILNDN